MAKALESKPNPTGLEKLSVGTETEELTQHLKKSSIIGWQSTSRTEKNNFNVFVKLCRKAGGPIKLRPAKVLNKHGQS